MELIGVRAHRDEGLIGDVCSAWDPWNRAAGWGSPFLTPRIEPV